jgi:hypothetical protein
MTFSKTKKYSLVAIIVILIVIIIIIIIRKHKISYPILNIRADSTKPEFVDISWFDEETSAIYVVYWSDKKNINPYDHSTFTHFKTLVGTRVSIHAPYQYVYFRIAKQGFKSQEIEVEVMSDTTFNLENLGLKILKRGDPMTLTLNILQNADIYRIYHKLPNGDIFSQDFHVKGMSRFNIKIPRYDDAMIHMSYLRNEKESDLRFLMYNEKISPARLK